MKTYIFFYEELPQLFFAEFYVPKHWNESFLMTGVDISIFATLFLYGIKYKWLLKFLCDYMIINIQYTICYYIVSEKPYGITFCVCFCSNVTIGVKLWFPFYVGTNIFIFIYECTYFEDKVVLYWVIPKCTLLKA